MLNGKLPEFNTENEGLRHHFQTIHEGKNPNKPMPHWPSGKILHCHDCKYQSKDYKVFKNHIEMKHKPRAGEPFVCYMCDFETEKTHLWINHIKTIFRCIICGDKFHSISRNQGLEEYGDHIREEHPEVNTWMMRSDDRIPDSGSL